MEAKIINVQNMVNVPVHTIVFKDYDEETVLNTQQVHDWDKATAPTNPTREWYTFTWRNPTFSASSPVYASATYIAEYEKDSDWWDNTPADDSWTEWE